MSNLDKPAPLIAWADVETTGLDANKDLLLEIAFCITDATPDLNIIEGTEYHAIVAHERGVLADAMTKASPYVLEMHAKTGLWYKVAEGQGKSLRQIDDEIARIIHLHGGPAKTAPLGGNSVRLDFNFMERYLFRTYNRLDYHMRDVSSLAGFLHDAYGVPWFDKSAFTERHSAKSDLQACLAEARYYMKHLKGVTA